MLSPSIGFRDSRRSKVDTSTVSIRRRVRRNRAQWRQLLERFAASGQSREEFCRARGLTLSSFERWRRALGQPAAARTLSGGEPLFLELTTDARASARDWDLELDLGAGVILRLRRPC